LRGVRRLVCLAVVLAAPQTAAAAELDVRSGEARAVVTDAPFELRFEQAGGGALRGTPGFTNQNGEQRASSATGLRRDGEAVRAELQTPSGPLSMRLSRGAQQGTFRIELSAATATTTFVQFATEGDRLYGTGERSDAVNRAGRETESYVADGPFREEDRNFVKASTPPWAQRDRDDATYFPVPWVLSSRGWGVLIDNDATSRFRSTDAAFTADVDGPAQALRVFSGPTPAQALARFTEATGRQPAPAAPYSYGPWFQTGQPNVVPDAEERAIVKAQRDAGAPVSVAETQMHYLPCGAHEGREEAEKARTAAFHREGLARLVYFNPLLCVSYGEVYSRADAEGVLQKGPGGGTFSYPAFVGGSGPAGFTEEPLAQFDFTHPKAEGFYRELVKEAVDHGADGWMEDFGESTPPAVVQHDGSTGDAAHNRYPRDYHCAVQRIARSFDRPLVRFLRSGWTGTAACADVVWGGDPTTVWGFDGLSSAVTQLLSMGLSGVSRWGTDIGGYNSFGGGYQEQKPGATEDEKLTPELLTRWIEFGALAPVMRTKRSGIALPSYARPQVYEKEQLPVWRRMTELHTQLNAYLQAADAEHRRSGLPIARHLSLVWPGEPRALDAHDEYLLGDSLLVAPVLAPGARERKLWLPPGGWVDFWRSARMVARSGAYRPGARARVLSGGRDVTVPAALGEPPLLVRAGAVLPLLDGDVDTLAPYGEGVVHLKDRADYLRLLAFPRGRSRSALADGAIASTESRRRWRLTARSSGVKRWTVDASLGSLRRPYQPRRVYNNGRLVKRSAWRYDRRNRGLRVEVRGARLRLDVRG
jgi:alpha-glucosidase (family GH31 glycosyl hydrolase)